jgi:transcriptional regulator with XRE-family HTH domain
MAERATPVADSWLRVAREVRGWSQDDLAEHSGVSKVAISRLERGLRTPRVETMRKLSRALGVEPHRLFPLGDDAPTPADVLAEYLGMDR